MTTARDVLLFVPNLIGYGRVLCTASALVVMVLLVGDQDDSSASSWWWVAITLYLVSFVGDLFDGMAARRWNQCSTYGGLLDMVTDRCSTAGLLYVLSGEYASASGSLAVLGATIPVASAYRLLFLGLMLLDVASHWCQMYASAALQQHHKSSDANADRFFLVRWYYHYYFFFGYCCVGAEFTYICLYVLRYCGDDLLPLVVRPFFMVCLPACATKQLVNVSQLCSACYAVAQYDAERKDR